MDHKFSRRDFFRGIGLGTIGAGLNVSFDSFFNYAEALTEAEKHMAVSRGTVNFMGFRAKEITPNEEFYITSYSSDVPDIDPERHRLTIDGLVEKPYSLTMDDLYDLKDRTEFVTLECIGNSVGGMLIGNALWEGVTMKKIIERAVPKNGIVKTVFRAEDGYSDSIPYSLSVSDDVFLAFRMNGKPLPPEHGYPLRVIVPGIYGMKNVKWLSSIELVDYDYKGYWEKKGWSDEAVIPIKSQILMPMDDTEIPYGTYVAGGIAFAGRHRISRVQLSLDDGDTWHDAEIKEPLSRWSWVLWRYEWKPSEKGKYTLKVRGVDRSGRVQEKGGFFSRVFPDGAKGHHSVDVKVV